MGTILELEVFLLFTTLFAGLEAGCGVPCQPTYVRPYAPPPPQGYAYPQNPYSTYGLQGPQGPQALPARQLPQLIGSAPDQSISLETLYGKETSSPVPSEKSGEKTTENYEDFEKKLAELKASPLDDSSTENAPVTLATPPLSQRTEISQIYLRPDASGAYGHPDFGNYARPVPYRPQPMPTYSQPYFPQPIPRGCPMPMYRAPPPPRYAQQPYRPVPLPSYQSPQTYAQIPPPTYNQPVQLPTPLPIAPSFPDVPPPSPFNKYHSPLNDCCARCGAPCRYKAKQVASGVANHKNETRNKHEDNEVSIGSTKQIDGPIKCSDEKLKKIMEKATTSTEQLSKRMIQRLAEEALGGAFFVVCSRDDFSYVSRAETFCQTEKNGVVCYAFQHR